MKRVLAVIMALSMIVTFAACGSKNNEPVWEGPELVRNPQIDLGDNLPSFVLTGEYQKDEMTEALAAEGVVVSYTALSPKVESLCVYNIPANGGTIMDRMNAENELYGLEEQQLYFQEFDTLIEPNDYHYGYYMAYREAADGTPIYTKNYIFLDGGNFVKVEFKIPAYEVGFEELRVKMALPYGMDESDIPEEVNEDGAAIACFTGEKDDNYAQVTAYALPTEGKDLKSRLKFFEDQYEVKVQYFYSYPISGKEQECVYIVFLGQQDGVDYQYESILTIIDDNYVEFCYGTEYEEGKITAQQMSVAPMMWGIDAISAQ